MPPKKRTRKERTNNKKDDVNEDLNRPDSEEMDDSTKVVVVKEEIDIDDVNPSDLQATDNVANENGEIKQENSVSSNHYHEEHDIETSLKNLSNLIKTNMELIDSAVDILVKNGTETLNSQAFLELDVKVLKEILKSDKLEIPEVEIFKAACRWAQHKGNIGENAKHKWRKIAAILGKCLYLIRFPLMSKSEFVNSGASAVVTKSERHTLLIYFKIKDIDIRRKIIKDEYDTGPFSNIKRVAHGQNSGDLKEPAESAFPRRKRRRSISTPTPSTSDEEGETKRSRQPSSSSSEDIGLDGGRICFTCRDDTSGMDSSEDENEDSDGSFMLGEFNRKYRKMNPQDLEKITEIIPEKDVFINLQKHPQPHVGPMVIPNLKEFVVSYKHGDGKRSWRGKVLRDRRSECNTFALKDHENGSVRLWQQLTPLDLTQTLLFFRHSQAEISPEEYLQSLWKNGIKIKMKLEVYKGLQINHEEQSLTISTLCESAKAIISGLVLAEAPPLRKLCLEFLKINYFHLIPPENLTVLVLKNVTIEDKDRISFLEFIWKCQNLLELSIHVEEPYNCNKYTAEELFAFDVNLKDPSPTLEKLSLGSKRKLQFTEPMKNLQELFLNKCFIEDSIIEKFSEMFPALKKICLFNKSNLKMAIEIMKHPKLEWIGISGLNLPNNDEENRRLLKEFLNLSGIKDKKVLESTFTLKKASKTSKRKWTEESFFTGDRKTEHFDTCVYDFLKFHESSNSNKSFFG